MTATKTTKIFAGMLVLMTMAFGVSAGYAHASQVFGTLSAGTVASGQSETSPSNEESVSGVLSANVGSSGGSPSQYSGNLTASVTGGSFSGGSVGGNSVGGGESFGGNSLPPLASNFTSRGTDVTQSQYPYAPGAPNTGAGGGEYTAQTQDASSSSTSSPLLSNPNDLTAAAADAGLSGPERALAIILGIIALISLIGYGLSTRNASRRS